MKTLRMLLGTLLILVVIPVMIKATGQPTRANPFAPLSVNEVGIKGDIKNREVNIASIRSDDEPIENISAQINYQWHEAKQTFNLSADDVEIKQLIFFVAKKSGFNIVLNEEVKGFITILLTDMSWPDAIRAIATAGGYYIDNTKDIYVISNKPPKNASRVFPLTYSRADEVLEAIEKVLSPTGKVGSDLRTNSIVVNDAVFVLDQIEDIIKELDREEIQILIEVLMVNIKLTDGLKMGVNWNVIQDLNKGTLLSTSNPSGALDIKGEVGTNGTLSVGFTTGNLDVSSLIQFIETEENIRVMTNTRLLVLNHQMASVESVEELPYQEASNTSEGGQLTSIQYKDAGVKVFVTPHVTGKDLVIHVQPELSAQVGILNVEDSQVPIMDVRKTETTLQVTDGETIILSGLRKVVPKTSNTKVPLLGDIPLFGLLFQKNSVEDEESEMAVFITPHIVSKSEIQEKSSTIRRKIESKLHDNNNQPITNR